MSISDLTASLPAWSRPLAPGLGAFLLTVAVTPMVIRLARRMGWVAEPREDRWHERPTALMGGIAIFVGTTAGWMLAPAHGSLWALWAAGTLLFLSGLADDLNGLSPVGKVVAQVAGATVILVAGWELAPGWPAWLSVSLTYLWVIGITNAVNLLDNMDGLAAGITAIAALTIGVLAAVTGAWATSAPALALVGAAGGFLVFNFQPARIFMGDSGALFLGFLVSALALSQPGAGASGTAAVLAVPAAVMAVPILDTTLVTVKRIVGGRPITQGGKDHSSHRLVFMGLSEKKAVLTLYGVAVGFSALAVALRVFNVYLTLAVAGLAGVALSVFGVFLSQVHISSDMERDAVAEAGEYEQLALLGAMLRNKREIAGLLADLVLIVAAFVVAHYLRFEAGFAPEHAERMVQLLPAVVLVKIGTLYAFGVYRGMPRYAGSHELIQVVKGSSVASGLMLVGAVLAFRFVGFSRSVFVIDWLMATVSLAAVRGAFRGLRSYFALKREGGRRVLLYGADDAGLLALRKIHNSPSLDLLPVAFLDDAEEKQGRQFHGMRIMGAGTELERISDELDIDVLVVTDTDLPMERKKELRRQCGRAGIDYVEAHIDFVLPE